MGEITLTFDFEEVCELITALGMDADGWDRLTNSHQIKTEEEDDFTRMCDIEKNRVIMLKNKVIAVLQKYLENKGEI